MLTDLEFHKAKRVLNKIRRLINEQLLEECYFVNFSENNRMFELEEGFEASESLGEYAAWTLREGGDVVRVLTVNLDIVFHGHPEDDEEEEGDELDSQS